MLRSPPRRESQKEKQRGCVKLRLRARRVVRRWIKLGWCADVRDFVCLRDKVPRATLLMQENTSEGEGKVHLSRHAIVEATIEVLTKGEGKPESVEN
ncbi:hypothetical protein HBI56_084430 [Parastagonospora nodorum]|nr:hypothetical protein HBH53_062300 [Parastagonospora nodorum]KAH3975248.1 hypothetical protein HBH52_124560 [Parastagonospora nodorum]KAH3998921.1 hypothetical protein HBI10_118140 [Parastagonospora nodorum]KAH4025231.1 hypothetical protein HBI13_079040 [Parastagonospora nodorum]KAH4049146.1 hypothetical protein HBH49_142960 [Parastagonospora nodorum]